MRSRLLVILLLAAGAVLAQPRPDLLSVTRWRFNFTIQARTSGNTSSALEGTYTWDFKATATGSAILTATEPLTWEGVTNITVTGGYTSKWILPSGNCVFETNAQFNAKPEDTEDRPALLSMVRDDGFQIEIGPRAIKYPKTTTEVCPDRTSVRTETEYFDFTPVWSDVFPYPASGAQLAGSAKDKSQIISGQIPPINDGDFDLNFTLVPDISEELSVEIQEDGDNYRKWRPGAARDGGPGEPLSLTARLVSSTGNAPNARVSSIRWELKNTSREPGIALNWPADAADQDYDLRLDPAGPLSTSDADRQWVERIRVEGFSDKISVVPHDWGGWGDLEVTFYLTDGRSIRGKLKTTGESVVRLPRRQPSSKVADSWKEAQAAKGRRVGADGDDNESRPDGDGAAGDGLTVYEEYRGFYEAGDHIEGDPGTKDLFVLDKTGGAAAGGIARLRKITKLAVHGKLQEAELPANRVVNKNTKAGAHAVAQHGIVIVKDNAMVGMAEARGGPGTPKKVSEVALPGDYANWPDSYLASTLAHELLHSLNVYHHGEVDRRARWQSGNDGVMREFYNMGPAEGVPIRVLRESREDVTHQVLNVPAVWVGIKRGQHSGVENCVMRYDNSIAYVGDDDAGVRYLVQESVGQALCATPNGTGVNDSGWNPQSRYREASEGRGNCTHQVLVNDAVPAPAR